MRKYFELGAQQKKMEKMSVGFVETLISCTQKVSLVPTLFDHRNHSRWSYSSHCSRNVLNTTATYYVGWWL